MKAEDIQHMRSQIEEEQKTIKETQEKVLNLLNDLIRKESTVENLDSPNYMKISLPNRSLIGSLFQDDDTNYDHFFKWDKNERKERLASERRAEYNAFLERKEQEFQTRRKVPEEKRSVTPKSILESVDYEKVLAKMKAEESRFRNLNRAEPNVEKQVEKSPIHTPRSVKSLPEEKTPRPAVEPVRIPSPKESHRRPAVEPVNIPSPKETHRRPALEAVRNSPPKEIPKTYHRTGGGGDPVKDSFGNLITARGFKDMPMGVMGFPSFTQESPVNRNNAYREELKRQIEEKRRLEALEKQKAKQLEEQMAQRIEQQRRQMQIEYEKELAKNTRRNEQLQQERLRQLEEFQRQDAVFRNQRPKETVLLPSPKLSNGVDNHRSISPPVPAVRSKVILERTVSPVVTAAKTLNEVKPENVFSSLAEIRRTIMKDQHNSKKDFMDSYEVTNRRTVPNVLDDYED